MTLKMITAAMACMMAAISATAQTDDEGTAPRTAQKNKYAKNVVALAPIQMSEHGVAGLGLSYEHSLDRNGIISLYVPVSAVMNTRNDQNYYGGTTNNTTAMVYVMPGVKLYPTGNQGVAKYAVGPSIVFATGQKTLDYAYTTMYPNYNYYYGPNYVNVNHTMLGMIVNQSLNINPTPHLYIGTELGLGFSYLNKVDGINNGTTGLVQFSFRVGYRF